MRNGKMVEQGPTRDVFASPQTDYTKALIAAALNLGAAAEGVVRQ
jgi:microcin C transport system ATP-binding protein